MISVIVWFLILIVSIIVLVKSSDYFTDYAEKLGLFLKMSPFVIGIVIVAFGTSLPELISSIYAVLSGVSEIVAGNVIGSNIANILLILGISAILVKEIKISKPLISVDLPFLVASTFLAGLLMMDGSITIIDAIIFLFGFVVYIYYSIKEDEPAIKNNLKKEVISAKKKKKEKFNFKIPFVLVISLIGILIGSKYTVESVVAISKLLNVGAEIIAVTVVALGTSLPELSVSISAIRKNKPDIAVGNILGSNMFNIFGVLGLPALFGTLVITQSIIMFSLPFLIVITVLLTIMLSDNKLSRYEGIMLLLFYAYFIGHIVGFV